MSLKERGNEEVKKGNIPGAIECYLKYVDEEHEDNYTAFTNLALCYFKLKQHEPCIKACRNSLEQNPDNAKAYYRLYMTYKELPEEEYNTFINAQLFLKHFHQDNQTSRAEAIKVAKEYKVKFSKTVASEKMEDDLIDDLNALGEECIQKDQEGKTEMSSEEWINYFQDASIAIDQKAQRIKSLILSHHELGINLAFLLLSKIDNNENKASVSEKIAQGKRQYAEVQAAKKGGQSSTPKEQTEEEEQKQCVNNDDDDSQGKVPFEQQKQDSEEQCDTQTQNQAMSASKPLTNDPPQQESTVETTPSPPIVPAKLDESIEIQFNHFMKTHQQSRDVWNLLFNIICKILTSQQSQEKKRGYLNQIQTQCKDISLLKFSLDNREKKQLFELLRSNGFQKQFKFCKAG